MMRRLPYPSTPLIVWFYVVLFALVMGMSHYLGGPDDIESAADTEASLLDALQQAQAEASLLDALQQAQAEQPDLWTIEQRVRAKQAARIAAQHPTVEVQP